MGDLEREGAEDDVLTAPITNLLEPPTPPAAAEGGWDEGGGDFDDSEVTVVEVVFDLTGRFVGGGGG